MSLVSCPLVRWHLSQLLECRAVAVFSARANIPFLACTAYEDRMVFLKEFLCINELGTEPGLNMLSLAKGLAI